LRHHRSPKYIDTIVTVTLPVGLGVAQFCPVVVSLSLFPALQRHPLSMRGRGPPALGRRDEVLAPARDQTARSLREARRSGVLSLPARNLTAFPTEAYHLDEHMDKDEKKWECVDLVKVDLSHNAIPSLADDIGGLVTLTSVKLAQNKLTSLPDGFFELTALTYLDLSQYVESCSSFTVPLDLLPMVTANTFHPMS
jgi:hypothetical protein